MTVKGPGVSKRRGKWPHGENEVIVCVDTVTDPMRTLHRGPVCSCHSDGTLYGELWVCPACKHRSFDFWSMSCERRVCAYVIRAETS